MGEHTPEPWEHRFENGCNGVYFGSKHCQWIAMEVSGRGNGGKPERNANAARIVACVNALAGVDDPAALVRDVRELVESALIDLAPSEYASVNRAALERVAAHLFTEEPKDVRK